MEGVEEDCTDREVWLGLYDDFAGRRKVRLSDWKDVADPEQEVCVIT